MALGATTRAVTGGVLMESMRLALMGAALGAMLALGMSRVLASSLVMINTFDGVAYGGAAVIVLATCAVAAYLPSRRAARIDPMIALRFE